MDAAQAVAGCVLRYTAATTTWGALLLNLLAIDTAGERCSVALGVDDAVFDASRLVRRSHNEVLLEMVDGLFRSADLRPAALEGVCFNAGPASFTGVRLAAAAAQAIGFATGALVAPIRSSELLAAHAFAQGEEAVVTSTRSRAQLYYLAFFTKDGGCAQPDALMDAVPAWWQPGTCVAGQPPPWLDATVTAMVDERPAATLLGIGQARWPGGAFGPPERALPIYVSGDDPWRG